MNSRDRILKRLRSARVSVDDPAPIDGRRRMVPLADLSPDALHDHFIAEAEKAACLVQIAESVQDGTRQILTLIGDHRKVMCWEFSQLPLAGLQEALAEKKIAIADAGDADVEIGLTGVEAGLAATGSLVLQSGQGKTRSASLLPPIHIAIMTADQIVPDLETWMEQQRSAGLAHFQSVANTVVISGPSRTADIGMELVMGAHGPAELHIILLKFIS